MTGAGGGRPDAGLGRLTSLAPADATASLVQTLTALGAQVTTRTDTSLTGVVTVQQNPNLFLVLVLLVFCVLPGIVYLVIARRTLTYPFSIQLAVEGDGTRVTYAGQDAALRVAAQAVHTLPAPPAS